MPGAPPRTLLDKIWDAHVVERFDDGTSVLYIDRLDDSDWKTVQKLARKRGWGKPGAAWMPGVDHLED